MLNVVDYLHTMSLVAHASSKLRDVFYDIFCFEIVSCIPTTFNGDVLFKLPPLIGPNCHFGQKQGMDKKHDGHVWYKVKTINIKNNFNLNLQKIRCLGHLQC
jgi:hypothetical protein